MAINSILKQLTDDDPLVQNTAVNALEQLGNKEAVTILVKLLDDTKWRGAKGFDPNARLSTGEAPQGRNIYEPLGYLALQSLERLIPASSFAPLRLFVTDDDLQRWKLWWNENQKSILNEDISSS